MAQLIVVVDGKEYRGVAKPETTLSVQALEKHVKDFITNTSATHFEHSLEGSTEKIIFPRQTFMRAVIRITPY